MKVGTKSLLFGVHNFIWHPMTVLFAWITLYGLPNYRELICIFIHDWGYWGCSEMDGDEGSMHPEFGAEIARYLFGPEYEDLCLCHSRHYAKAHGMMPSKLCYADKLSIAYDPMSFYLLRARLTGELRLYREESDKSGLLRKDKPDAEWFMWIRAHLVAMGIS